MILILHAFSRRNAGDGLLVDLTLEALAAAGVRQEECVVLALDPESFADLEHVERAPGEPRAVLSANLLRAITEVGAGMFGKSGVDALARDARGLVAVGGGYLVADSPVRQAGVMLNHYAQLRAAASASVPSIYLPQSIGPLSPPVGPLVRRQLRRLTRLYVRDDQTLGELGGANIRRCGDLAVMKLARELPDGASAAPGSDGPVIVARDLPHDGTYRHRLLELRTRIPDARFAVQADVEGPRSDRLFYRKLGVADSGSLASILDGARPSVVVSVRLHGAIAALLAGVPAIHLAYERKGWGAYQDMGLQDYVHDARTFDPTRVSRQAEELALDPRPMWARLSASRARLQLQYESLVGDLRNLLKV